MLSLAASLLFATLLPGPKVVLLTVLAIGQGPSRASQALLGITLGNLAQGALLGIGLVFAGRALPITVFAWVAGAVLIGLGVRGLAASRRATPDASSGRGASLGAWRSITTGFVIALATPVLPSLIAAGIARGFEGGAQDVLVAALLGTMIAAAIQVVVFLPIVVFAPHAACLLRARPALLARAVPLSLMASGLWVVAA